MTNGDNADETLRGRAEQRLADRDLTELWPADSDSLRTLVHELQVHQIELELQNEELRRSEGELLEASDRYRNLFEFAPMSYFMLDAGGTVREANLAAATLCGLTRDRLIGRQLRRLLRPEDRGKSDQLLKQVAATGIQEAGQLRLDRPDKQARWVKMEVALRGKQGEEPGGFWATMSDITERIDMEQALRRREEEFHALADNVPALFSYVDAGQRYRYVNHAYEGSWRTPAQDIIGRTVREVLGAKNYAVAKAWIDAVLGGKPVSYRGTFEYPDGPHTMQVNYVPDQGERGQVNGFFALISDVTELTRAELAVQEQHKRLQAILQSAGDGLLTIDEDGNISDCNPAAEHMFGCPATGAVGQPITRFIVLPGGGTPRELFNRYLEHAPSPHGPSQEVVGRRADGTEFPLELVLSAVDHLGLYVLALRDISGRRRLEQEVIEASTLEQERIGREIHDGVGQWLTGITMLASSLEHRLEEGGSTEAAQVAGELAGHLRKLLVDVGALARGLAPVGVDPASLDDALVDLAGRIRETSGIDCRFTSAGKVHLTDASAANQLYRIAQEALNNAVKHAEARHIVVSLKGEARRLVLAVVDDGIGIEPMGDRRGRLGLHIMRYRAGSLGGQLEISRPPAGGTEVRCSVPMPN